MSGEKILEAARQQRESIPDEMKYSELLKFSLDDDWYGMSIEDVVGVIKCEQVFSIPHTPDYVTGVISVKGEILAIIDMVKLLGLSGERSALPNDQRHIVVVERDNVKVGVMVDKVSGIISIPDLAIEPVLSTADGERRLIAGGVRSDGEVLAILDLGKLIEGTKG